MALFNYIFLGTEYLFDNIVGDIKPQSVVTAQSYILGASVLGFLFFAIIKKYINTDLSEKVMVTIDGYRFEINLIVWQESISEKFCCYYFDDKNVLKGNRTTTFNRNTVNFNHSVFVKSEFFDDKENVIGDHNDTQINMFEYPDEKRF